jgi:Tfp pilus assembly protein PilO
MDVHILINKAKDNILNIIIIIIAVIIAFNHYKTKTRDVKSLKDTLNTELKKNEVLGDISNLEKKFTLFRNKINDKSISLVIDSLGNMAKESDVKIILVKPQNAMNLGYYTSYPFQLTVVAKDYHQIGKFISIIENSPDIYIIENIMIRTNPEAEGEVITNLLLDTITIN